MANFNKVILAGRLCADPESRSFASGGMVVNLRLAVTNRKKNNSTNQWEDDPLFIDCAMFGGSGNDGKQTSLLMESCRKGSGLLIEGRLVLESWDDKATGAKRQKIKLVVGTFQFLDAKRDGGQRGGGQEDEPSQSPAPQQEAIDPNSIPF